MNLLWRTVAGVGAAGAVMFVLWRLKGPFGLVYASPLMGIALARPIVEAAFGTPRLLRGLALRKVAGRYVEYRGKSLDVHVDERANCWIATADLRKLVALPPDLALQRRFPAGCRETGDPSTWRLEGQALVEFLALSTDPDSARFCHWLQRDVMRPAYNKRADRMGLPRRD